MKKKIIGMILTVLVVCLSFSAFAGCDNNKPDNRTELSILSWNFGTVEQNLLNRRMVKAFEEKYTDYKVKILEAETGNEYSAQLVGLSSRKELPDVFMLPSLAMGLTHDLLLELTDMADKDPDWAKVPKPLDEASRFNDRVYAVPAEMHLTGLFVNDTVFEAKNINMLEVNPSYESFKKAVETLSSPANGIASLNNEATLLEWYPAAMNKDLGWYTFDGEKYNLDTPEFRAAFDEMQDIRRRKLSYDSWTVEEREATGAKDIVELFQENGLAMYYGATYERDGLYYGQDKSTDNPAFQGKLRYVGTPGGRNAIIPDILGISAATKHADAAYNLAKWLSFDPEGILKKIELDKAGEFVSLPLTSDKVALDAYFDNIPVLGLRTGLKKVFATIDDGIVEGVKIIPGYVAARWDYATDLKYTVKDAEGKDVVKDKVKIGEYFDDIRLLKTADTLSSQLGGTNGINAKTNAGYGNATRALNNRYPKK